MGYLRTNMLVVGVDIAPQPKYPLPFIQMDAIDALKTLLMGDAIGSYVIEDFDAIHASPPCQRYSATQRIRSNDHPDLIGPTRELLEETGLPYIIENVMDARSELRDPVMLCGAMFPQLRVYRHRLFESNIKLTVPDHPKHVAPQVKMGRPPQPGEWVQAVGNFSGVQEARDAMEIQWMNRDGLRESIPPAYTEYLGRQLLDHINDQRRIAA